MGDRATAQTLNSPAKSKFENTTRLIRKVRAISDGNLRPAGASDNRVALHFCDLDNTSVSIEDCMQLLPDEDAVRARRFLRDADRRLFCIGKLMLRTVLAAYTGCTVQSITLSEGPHGKPCMENGPSFNLSHSGSAVLVGIAAAGDLGVDIESVRSIDDIDGLARSCLSDREYAALAGWPADDRLRAFFRAWTRKEALVKAFGTGLNTDTKCFSVSLEDTNGNSLLDAAACRADSDSWAVMPVRLPGEFEAAVAWNRPSFAIEVREFDAEILSS